MQNLITNGIKYCESETPYIRIHGERQDGKWLFVVSDNGIGIDQKFHHKIFDPFARLHGLDYPGTGLGLVTCQNVVECHNGSIWCESKEGKGSAFHFSLAA